MNNIFAMFWLLPLAAVVALVFAWFLPGFSSRI